MRKRFKTNRIASSDNYELSRRTHNDIDLVKEVTASMVITKTTYVKIFGKLIPVSQEEIKKHKTLEFVTL